MTVPSAPRAAALASLLVLLGAAPARGDGGAVPGKGWQLREATAATVNGEVIFLSDVERESCLVRCGAFPGDAPRALSLDDARSRLIADALILQEQRKLGLGSVDNEALAAAESGTVARMVACDDPCARVFRADDARAYAARRLLVQSFVARRIEVFADVSEDEVAREAERRAAREGVAGEGDLREAVRRELVADKIDRETRNWFVRATSKSRIILSPLEGR